MWLIESWLYLDKESLVFITGVIAIVSTMKTASAILSISKHKFYNDQRYNNELSEQKHVATLSELTKSVYKWNKNIFLNPSFFLTGWHLNMQKEMSLCSNRCPFIILEHGFHYVTQSYMKCLLSSYILSKHSEQYIAKQILSDTKSKVKGRKDVFSH